MDRKSSETCMGFTRVSDGKINENIFGNRTYLGAETAEESEPNVTQSEREVFVEKIPQKFTHSVIGPSAVDQKQTF